MTLECDENLFEDSRATVSKADQEEEKTLLISIQSKKHQTTAHTKKGQIKDKHILKDKVNDINAKEEKIIKDLSNINLESDSKENKVSI